MTTAETLERPAADAEARAVSIRQVVFEQLRTVAPEADLEAIDPNADLRDVIDFDSIDLLNFTMALNKRLGITIEKDKDEDE